MSRIIITAASYLGAGFFSLVFAVYIAGFFLRPTVGQEGVDGGGEAVVATEASDPSSGRDVFSRQSEASVASILEPYIFDAREGRRNPFEPSVLAIQQDASPDLVFGPLTPLERFDLDQLRLIGIMWDIRSPRAMFKDPNEQIHVVGKDDRIGRRRGYVAAIREGEVVVVEAGEFGGDQVFATRVIRID